MTSAHWHSSISPELRELCETACTPRQIEALVLKSQGYGAGRIGWVLGINEGSARRLLNRAILNVQQEEEKRKANARWN
jgi:DNA-binding CsgD family transcriptional regulator